MEQWEIDKRKKLEEELPDGFYNISSDKMTVCTGKGGQIEFEIALEKEIRKIIKE